MALVERIGTGDHAAFESLMRTYNGKLFRIARAILKDDGDAEDALQDAYLEAYRHLSEYVVDAHRRQPGADAASKRKTPLVHCAVPDRRVDRRREPGDASA